MNGKNFKQRIISFILVLIMAIGMLPLSAVNGADSLFAGGNGTQENPYRVSTTEQLSAVRSNLDAYYIQINDINLLTVKNWIPIGSDKGNGTSKLFNGQYDGAEYSIYNLTINTGEYDTVGLFGSCGGKSIISNINLQNINIDVDKSSTDYSEIKTYTEVCVGGIVGKSGIPGEDYAIIMNCSVSGYVNVKNCLNALVGGIVGHGNASQCVNYANINVLNNRKAWNSESVSGTVCCGGVTGHTGMTGNIISKNINYGDITATAGSFVYCGGISGKYGRFNYCINYGDIEGTVVSHDGWNTFASNSNVGGIVGATYLYETNNLVNMGNISAYAFGITNYFDTISSSAGGIIGYLGNNDSGKIENCYNGATNIVSYRHKFINGKQEIIDANAGRICGAQQQGGYNENLILEAYSVNTKTNGEISKESMTKIGKDGETVSIDFINVEIDRIYAVIAPNEINPFEVEKKDITNEKILKFIEKAESQPVNGGNIYNLDGRPWCMDFVVWCASQVEIPLVVSEITDVPFIYNTRNCNNAYYWYSERGRIHSEPKIGALVLFWYEDYRENASYYGHVGIVVGINNDKTINVVEGNLGGEVAHTTWPKNVDTGWCYYSSTYDIDIYIGGYAYID
jgi:hypothetical protein